VAIHAALRAVSKSFASGERRVDTLRELARSQIAPAFDAIDYISVANADDLSEPAERCGDHTVMLVAARIGATRLLDNAVLGQECCE
jgi:pantoate--beta-alanine ligase